MQRYIIYENGASQGLYHCIEEIYFVRAAPLWQRRMGDVGLGNGHPWIPDVLVGMGSTKRWDWRYYIEVCINKEKII